MANQNVHPPIGGTEERRSDRRDYRDMKKNTLLGGVAVESVGALAAVVLSIIALAGTFEVLFAAISAIGIGLALLFEGVTIGAQSVPGEHIVPRTEPEAAEIGAEAIAGLTGVVLGILALVDAASPYRLLPIAAIVLGAGMIFAVHPLSETLHAWESQQFRRETDAKEEAIQSAGAASSGAHLFAGIGAVVLGIVGVVNPGTLSLSLAAYLALGVTLLLGSAAVGGRIFALRR